MAAKRATSGSDSGQERIIPGTGPTMTVSTSLHSGTVEAVRSRVGKRGFSAYVEAALTRQIEQDNLAELVDEYTSAEGNFTPEELAAARAELYGTEDAGTGNAA
ncbi:MAG TPA: hypothetical protein VMV07_01175 [Streptosporangiaceae bacterium]|nr:hypothetical protein [Streptosporangiaceae bacterium]